MASVQTWVVCEQSARWAAALRLAIARRSNSQRTPRLHEVRGLEELVSFLNEHSSELALVEVGRANLAEVMEFLADEHTPQTGRKVVLLDHDLCTSDAAVRSDATKRQVVIDALWEAGAADI